MKKRESGTRKHRLGGGDERQQVGQLGGLYIQRVLTGDERLRPPGVNSSMLLTLAERQLKHCLFGALASAAATEATQPTGHL